MKYAPRAVCPHCGSRDTKFRHTDKVYYCRRCPTRFREDGSIIEGGVK